MIERRIKELTIAMEALSRINTPAASQATEAIEELLNKAISQARKEYDPPPKQTETDDDIPF